MKKSQIAIQMEGITKSFLNGKIIANDNINISIKTNEIHAILGENGAGKSTLMSILFGIYNQDAGTIKINGETVYFNSAKDAVKYGLGMVHQHFKLVPTYTVYENIILGDENTTKYGGILKHKTAKEKLNKLIKYYNFNIDINKKVNKLTVGQQQKIEILKLLYRDLEILIFDEPTAVLSQDEIKQFLKMILKFKEDNKTVIIITHKLLEVKEVADWATVIRRGKYIADFKVSTTSIAQMAELMIGKKIVQNVNKRDSKFGKVILKIDNLFIGSNKLKPINFEIKAGEIYAIAGVEGNGQSELALQIAGLNKTEKGKIILNEKDITNLSIKKRSKIGLSHVPEDRHKHGLILDMSIALNSVIDIIDYQPFSKLGLINNPEIKEFARNLIHKYDVRGTTRGTAPSRLLSGGNQQKLIVGREITKEHNLIVLVQPIRGLDLGAIEYIRYQILREKEKGKAILLISYELDEILALADTIAVIYNNSLIDSGNIDKMKKDYIGTLMMGKH